ncbi:MAG TPA: hypothetical protein VKR53_09470 [Puia sp.]|nr:hypothetical protein [Puia sp.]
MKRILGIVCIMVLVFRPTGDYAQSVSVVNKNEKGALYYYHDARNFITSNVPLNELSVKAYRHFEKNYADINQETWTKNAGGTLVTFTSNAAFCKIFYDTKGDFRYSFKYYNKKGFPAELTKMIENAYPQNQVVSLVELFDGEQSIFGINISNGEITKSLEMKNGEIKFLDEYRNQ